MTYRVLKELPQGQQPGDLIDATDAEGQVLLLVGAVERLEPSHAEEQAADASPSRRRYRRRDLEAETA